MATEKNSRLSTEASLKNVKAQVKDQRKKLHITEIELATQRQLVLELKANLEKAKEATRAVKEVVEALE